MHEGGINKPMRTPNKDYTPGCVLVLFNKEVTKEEAVNLVKSLALTAGDWSSTFNMLVVSVPVGEERQWVETFRKNFDMVLTAFLNLTISALMLKKA